MILEKRFTRIFDFRFQFEVMADFVLPVAQSTPIHMAEGVN